MAKKYEKKLVVGLDIGTSKVVTVVAEIDQENNIHIIGIGHQRSKGLKKGVVVNIEATVNSIKRAIEEAELMAGCQIHSVYTGIAGSHIRSLNSHGIVAIREQEVNQSDVERVIDAARAVAISADQKIIHILPQEFVIDEQDSIKEPVGMSGVRLEAKVHIVTGAVSAAQNIVKCVRMCGLEVDDIILEQLASSQAVLSDDEKELGVCLIDIGGGTTDIAIFSNGAIVHTAVIPIAGDQVTNDVAVALRTPTKNAEDLKIKHGCALSKIADMSDMVYVSSVGERPAKQISRKVLAEIIEPRYEELFMLILDEIKRSGFSQQIASGIVLTGGSSTIPGAIDLAEDIFMMPVRLGMPQNISGLVDVVSNAKYSTAVGLLQYGAVQENSERSNYKEEINNFKGVFKRMRSWFYAS